MEQRLKERPSRDCPTSGSNPHTVTKPRHYLGCWEVLADRSLIWCILKCSSRASQIQRQMPRCSQPTFELRTGSPGDELEKGMKELRGPTAPCVGGATVSTIQTPEARGDWTTHQRVHIERLMALAVYVAEDGLVGHQWEERCLILWGFDASL